MRDSALGAAGEGFEPPSEVAPAAGFQDRRYLVQPYGRRSVRALGGAPTPMSSTARITGEFQLPRVRMTPPPVCGFA